VPWPSGGGRVPLESPTAQLGREANLGAQFYYPAAGTAFIRSEYPEARIFNTLIWGGYLIHELYPQRIFVDGRSDLPEATCTEISGW
jgi:hypothetical protein